MTAAEKSVLAKLLDLAEDTLGSGYRRDRPPVAFRDDSDDRRPAPAAASEAAAASTAGSEAIADIAAGVAGCAACGLSAGRLKAVPGEGVPAPLVLVVGEGPGADEDASGRPFVGKAGQLLDRMLAAVGLSRRTNCFIANLVKCRPPANRDPEPDEAAACFVHLERQIAALRPKVILAVGRVPSQHLLGTSVGIGKLRGRWTEWRGIPLLPTFHPSALLRDEELKRPAWEDLKALRARLEEIDEAYADALRQSGA
jgi:DNA polymerase